MDHIAVIGQLADAVVHDRVAQTVAAAEAGERFRATAFQNSSNFQTAHLLHGQT